MYALNRNFHLLSPKDAVSASVGVIQGVFGWVLRVAAVMLFLGITAAGVGSVSSQVENFVFPIMGNQTNSNIHWEVRDKSTQFCWTWSGDKHRQVEPVDFTHIMISRTVDGQLKKAFLPVMPIDTDGRARPFEAARAAPGGTSFSKPLCSVVPPWVDETTTFDIEGVVMYPGFMNLWNVRQHIPSIHHQGVVKNG